MTTQTLLTDQDLALAVAAKRVPLNYRDDRLELWERDARIWPGDDGVWHLNLRWQPPLPDEIRDYIADDAAYTRRLDV